MKSGAYQFAVTGKMNFDMEIIKKGGRAGCFRKSKAIGISGMGFLLFME